MLLYVSFVPILWTLWFLGFWAVAIVSAGSGGSFQGAALTAMFTGLSGVVGYPAGGWLADWTLRAASGASRCWSASPRAGGADAGAGPLPAGRRARSGGAGGAAVHSGLFFNALQPVAHALVADLAAPAQRGAAFGTYNLIGEIGAVLSPTVSGTMRDAFGGWAPAVYLDAALVVGERGAGRVRARTAARAGDGMTQAGWRSRTVPPCGAGTPCGADRTLRRGQFFGKMVR